MKSMLILLVLVLVAGCCSTGRCQKPPEKSKPGAMENK